MLKFFIEISYWAAYFMKWKSEKEIPFSSGVGWILLTLYVNLMTVLCIVSLYTPFTPVEDILSILPDGVLTKENKWTLALALSPIGLLVNGWIARAIYRKSSKKELFRHFKTMPPQRQTKGKAMFIGYSLGSFITLFFSYQFTPSKCFRLRMKGKPGPNVCCSDGTTEALRTRLERME